MHNNLNILEMKQDLKQQPFIPNATGYIFYSLTI